MRAPCQMDCANSGLFLQIACGTVCVSAHVAVGLCDSVEKKVRARGVDDVVVVRQRTTAGFGKEPADLAMGRMREIRAQTVEVVEFNDRRELVLRQHYLLVAGKAMLHATADGEAAH